MTHNNMTWHVTCCSHQDSQDSSFYRTCFGRNSAWTSGPACSSSNWCPNKSLITSLLRPVVTCHSIPPPRLTAARPGFIKSIATLHPRVPSSCSPVLTKPAPHLASPSPPHRSPYRHQNTAENTELENWSICPTNIAIVSAALCPVVSSLRLYFGFCNVAFLPAGQ